MATRVKKTETPAAETETTETEVTTPEPTGTSVQALLDEVEKATGKDYQPATIRVLLRKLAKEGKLQKGEGRWSLTDEEVETVIEAVQAGRAEKAPKEETADGEEKPKRKRSTKKAEPAPEPEEDEDDLEVDLDEL